MNSQPSTETPKRQTYTDRMCLFVSEQLTDANDGDIGPDEIKDVLAVIRKFAEQEQLKKRATSDRFPFGKFKGKTVQQVVEFGEKKYLAWLVKQDMMDNFPELKQNIEGVLQK